VATFYSLMPGAGEEADAGRLDPVQATGVLATTVLPPSPTRPGDDRTIGSPRRGAHPKEAGMVSVGLLVRLEARPGKEADVASFLEGGLSVVEEEPATIAWFAIRLGPSQFGIFDAFPDDAGRQAHLAGRVAAALMAQASELLAQPPAIEPVDVIAAKLPG
jgi:quinol monooxygenase YgiN